MGLNRISNPKKLRAISKIVGKTIVRAWARYFSRPLILAVTDQREWFVVNPKLETCEPYTDEPLIDYNDSGILYRSGHPQKAREDKV